MTPTEKRLRDAVWRLVALVCIAGVAIIVDATAPSDRSAVQALGGVVLIASAITLGVLGT